jgi:hypothetical protein
MKYFLLVAALVFTAPAFSAEKLLRLDDPNIIARAAMGKRMELVFSPMIRAKYFPSEEALSAFVTEIDDKKICFTGPNFDEPRPDDPRFKEIFRLGQADVCVSRSDASVRYDAREVIGATPQPFFNTELSSCKWVWKTGHGIGVWTEECNYGAVSWSVTYNAQEDYFAYGTGKDDRFPVLRQYHKAAGENLDVLLPELRAKKLIPDDECRFETIKDEPAPPHQQLYHIVPFGKRKAAFDARPGDEVPEPPCGELGTFVEYDAYFVIDDRHPDRVLYVNLGQDGTMFDPFSISLF